MSARPAESAPPAVPEFRVHATPESVARWLGGRDGILAPPPDEGAPLPLAYLVLLRMQPALGVSMHALLGRDPDRGLYGGVSYRAARTPRVGEVFIAAGAVTASRRVAAASGELLLREFETRYRNGGSVVVTETVRMVDLPPGPPRPPAAGPRREPRLPKLAELVPVSRTQVAWLTVETGDTNALHLDSAYAASRLYPDVVVPGTLIAAILERELAAVLGRPLRALDLRLHAASFPGEACTLHAGPSDGGLAYELYCGVELRAEGRAA